MQVRPVVSGKARSERHRTARRPVAYRDLDVLDATIAKLVIPARQHLAPTF